MCSPALPIRIQVGQHWYVLEDPISGEVYRSLRAREWGINFRTLSIWSGIFPYYEVRDGSLYRTGFYLFAGDELEAWDIIEKSETDLPDLECLGSCTRSGREACYNFKLKEPGLTFCGEGEVLQLQRETSGSRRVGDPEPGHLCLQEQEGGLLECWEPEHLEYAHLEYAAVPAWLRAVQEAGERVIRDDNAYTQTLGFRGMQTGTRWWIFLGTLKDRSNWGEGGFEGFREWVQTPQNRDKLARKLSQGEFIFESA